MLRIHLSNGNDFICLRFNSHINICGLWFFVIGCAYFTKEICIAILIPSGCWLINLSQDNFISSLVVINLYEDFKLFHNPLSHANIAQETCHCQNVILNNFVCT